MAQPSSLRTASFTSTGMKRCQSDAWEQPASNKLKAPRHHQADALLELAHLAEQQAGGDAADTFKRPAPRQVSSAPNLQGLGRAPLTTSTNRPLQPASSTGLCKAPAAPPQSHPAKHSNNSGTSACNGASSRRSGTRVERSRLSQRSGPSSSLLPDHSSMLNSSCHSGSTQMGPELPPHHFPSAPQPHQPLQQALLGCTPSMHPDMYAPGQTVEIPLAMHHMASSLQQALLQGPASGRASPVPLPVLNDTAPVVRGSPVPRPAPLQVPSPVHHHPAQVQAQLLSPQTPAGLHEALQLSSNLANLTAMQGRLSALRGICLQHTSAYLHQATNHLQTLRDGRMPGTSRAGELAVTRALETAMRIMNTSLNTWPSHGARPASPMPPTLV